MANFIYNNNNNCYTKNNNNNDEILDDDGDNEGFLGSIGFMFDAKHEKIRKEIIFRNECNTNTDIKTNPYTNDNNEIKIILNTIGDDPGHVQSGQYVWPASIASGNYFISIASSLLIKQCNRDGCVLELGAGCGLAGLMMSKFDNINTIILTDYDHGTLQLLHENVITNNFRYKDINIIDNNNIHYIDNDDSIKKKFIIDYLEWGKDIPKWDKYINIIIGADLLYCSDVVEPLIKTISKLK
jgi:predicted nicotinamide N-methyase